MRTSRISLGAFPHTELTKSVGRRVVDRRVLHLIKMWLECAVGKTTTEDGNAARPKPAITAAASRRAYHSDHFWRTSIVESVRQDRVAIGRACPPRRTTR